MGEPANRIINGADLAVLSNRMDSIVRKMSNTLMRSGRSGVLSVARDFSCCIVTRQCELLSAAESLPIHVLSGPDLMVRAMHNFHAEVARGDAFLHNSPYHGNSHAADHAILVPVIGDDGVHHFTVLAKAHQADAGNSIPSTYHPAARDVYEEGALIFPCVRLLRRGELIDDVIRMCEARIRVPSQWRGDLLATLGAALIGERELRTLAQEIGWDMLHLFEQAWFRYSEDRMDAVLRGLPTGSASVVSVHDPFPGTSASGIPVKVTVTTDAEVGSVIVDLTDNPDNLYCGLNLSESCARTAAMIGVFNSIDPDIPKNAGSLRRIHVRLRHGCVVGIPKHPFSCSVATTNLSERVTNATQRAFAQLSETFGMAEVGGVMGAGAAVLSGIDPRSQRPFVNQIFAVVGGGAASSQSDAWITIGINGCGGLAQLDGIELDELLHPITFTQRRLLCDTEGAGEFCGAPALCVEYGPIDCSITVAYGCDGVVNPAKGARGGGAGLPASQYKINVKGERCTLPGVSLNTLEPGESVYAVGAGGGGYGSPLARSPERVRLDVLEKWITPQRAREVYGVALHANWTVDIAATLRLRAMMKLPKSVAMKSDRRPPEHP